MSPTVLEAGGYKFFFYSREFSGSGLEPPHVHVKKGSNQGKVWIDSAELVDSWGFNPGEQRAIRKIVAENRSLLRQAWDEYFREPPSEGR